MYALRCRFYCCWCCYYTTARVNAAKIFAVGVGVRLPLLLLLVLLLHYGEVKCCSNFRPGVGVMLGVNAAHFTAMDVGVTLPKMFSWYLARTFTQLCDGDFVSFWRTTLLLLEVGALQQYFYLSRSLTQRTPFCPLHELWSMSDHACRTDRSSGE